MTPGEKLLRAIFDAPSDEEKRASAEAAILRAAIALCDRIRTQAPEYVWEPAAYKMYAAVAELPVAACVFNGLTYVSYAVGSGMSETFSVDAGKVRYL